MKTYIDLFLSDGLTRSEWRCGQQVDTTQWYQVYKPWIRHMDAQRAQEAIYMVGCGDIPEEASDDTC